jgi:hypothetical protein
MKRCMTAWMMIAVSAVVLPGRGDAQGAKDKWGTIKGQVVWSGNDIPPREELKVVADQKHCLMANETANLGKGTILDEKLLIDAKTRGVKNVLVWLINDPQNPLPIHPDLVKFPAEVVIDQPACMFSPRVLAMREGQVFVVKNSAPVQHNIKWSPDEQINKGGNQVIKPGGKLDIKGLKAQFLPISLECNLHNWMKGRLAVFNHPYYAITADDGSFTIKDAPVGSYRIMIYHEEIGYRLGGKGKNGEPITIKGGDNDLGKLPMPLK